MDEQTRQFLANAASIRLTPEEKARNKEELTRFMTGEEAVAELERDPLIRAFFSETAGLSLTVDETEILKQDLLQFVEEQAVRSQVEERHAQGMQSRSAILGDPSEVSLSKAERMNARRDIVSFMERTRSAQEKAFAERPLTLTEYLQDFWRVIVPRTAVLACAFLIVSTGAAFAAEGSVPGDWLYPLKVEVFEQVRGRFIFTSENKAEWEASLAMRRLEEAEWLAAHDDLTQASWLELHGNFVQHVMDAEYHIDALAKSGDASDAARLSADLDTYLSAHRTVLQAIGSERRNDPEIETALERVQDAQQNVSRKRDQRTTGAFSGEAEGTPERARAMAEDGIEDARIELSKVRRSANLQGESQASAKMREAEALLEQARNQFGAGLFEEARAVAREAVKSAAEAKILGKLPRELPLPAVHDDKEKENDATKPVSSARSASSRSAASGKDSSSAASLQEASSAAASAPSSESANDDDDAEIDVTVPGVDVKVDLNGLLD